MRRKFGYGFTLAAVLFSVFVLASVAFGARALYDDFSSGLTEYKFDAGPVQREISSGELLSGLARKATDNGFRKNRLPFANPDTINAIQADVRVDSTNPTEVESVAAQLEGVFYKAANGQEIWAGVMIGDQGYGLKAWWAISGINADQSIDILQWGDLIDEGVLSTGTFYTAKISYDGEESFTFEVNGTTQSFTLELPHLQRAGGPASALRSLTTVIQDTWDQSAGSVFARFDNVYVNNQGTVYDDFSTAVLDPVKWWQWEIARLIANPSGTNNLVRLDIRSMGGIIQSNTLPLQYDNTPYLEANIMVNSNTGMAADSMGRARISGYYYNQSRGFGSGQPYNGREGDVSVQAGLQTYFDGGSLKLKAVCRADVSNVDETAYTPLFAHDFATDVGFDTPHNFSILFTGTALTCSYDGVPFTYNIASPVYEPSESTRLLSSRVQPPTGGYLRAMYDDVYVDFQTITGTVVNESNVPVPGVAVEFWNEMDMGMGTVSGGDGTFTLNNVMPGGLGFRVRPDVSTGLAWYRDDFFLNPGQSLNLGTIQLTGPRKRVAKSSAGRAGCPRAARSPSNNDGWAMTTIS